MNTNEIESAALHEAIFVCGGQQSLAAKLTAIGHPISQQAISLWVKRGRGVPVHWVVPVERVTNVSRERLKASLYQAVA